MSEALLSVTGLSVDYGHIEAVRDVDLALAAGRVTTLVGANGAGKSTTLLALSGLVPKAAGKVMFDGHDVTALPAHKLVAAGLVQVAEGRATLATLSVRENLELGAYTRRDGAAARASDLERMFALFPRLQERANGLAGNLSGGEQQMLAIGRALMARPRVLLLDEPSMGLSPIMVDKIFEVIEAIHKQGTTVLLVEQNASRALGIADRGYVMESGEVTMDGQADMLLNDPKVRAAYLGE
jgi:branched-chain amino acid transport system ATP-binding protein